VVRAVRHSTFEDLQIHTRNIECTLLHSRVESVDQILQITTPGAVPVRQRLPSSVGHCLGTCRSKGRICVLVDHMSSIEYIH
jgi:hypothetical protein